MSTFRRLLGVSDDGIGYTTAEAGTADAVTRCSSTPNVGFLAIVSLILVVANRLITISDPTDHDRRKTLEDSIIVRSLRSASPCSLLPGAVATRTAPFRVRPQIPSFSN